MTKGYKKVMDEFCENTEHNNGYPRMEPVEFMTLERLNRIADALERIAGAADAVKSCISESGEFIRVGGEVYVDGDINVTVERDNWD